MTTKLVLALDNLSVTDLDRNDGKIYQGINKHVDVYKVSLPFILDGLNSPDLLFEFLTTNDIFFDFKLHDIPMQMEKCIESMMQYQAHMMTMHIVAGEPGMMAAAARLKGLSKDTNLIGVTVLTSLDSDDWKSIGKHSIEMAVNRFAQLANVNGLDGVVCADENVKAIKTCYPDLLTVVPGFRFGGSVNGDQKRAATDQSLNVKYVDYLVVGRTVTDIKNTNRMLSRLETIKLFLRGT